MRNPLRVAAAPPIHLITSDVAITTAFYSLSIDLPAGRHEIKSVLCLDSATLPNGTQNLAFYLGGSGVAVRAALLQTSWRSIATIPVMQGGVTNLSGVGFNVSMSPGVRVRYHMFGFLDLSQPRSLFIRLNMAVDPCVLRAGSFLRAEPRAAA